MEQIVWKSFIEVSTSQFYLWLTGKLGSKFICCPKQ